MFFFFFFSFFFFFFNDTATTEIYTLSLHDALPIFALVTAPDQLFQPLNPLLGPAPAQPPANIAILSLTTFAARIAPVLPTLAFAAGASAVPGAQTGTQWQVQAQVDRSALNGSPANALQQAT